MASWGIAPLQAAWSFGEIPMIPQQREVAAIGNIIGSLVRSNHEHMNKRQQSNRGRRACFGPGFRDVCNTNHDDAQQ